MVSGWLARPLTCHQTHCWYWDTGQRWPCSHNAEKLARCHRCERYRAVSWQSKKLRQPMMRCAEPYTARTSRTSFAASLWNVSTARSLSSLDTLLSSLVYVNSRSNRASSRAEISRLEWVQRRTFAHFCFIFESIWCRTCNRKGKTNLAIWYSPMEEWPVCSRHARRFCSLFVARQCHGPQLPQ